MTEWLALGALSCVSTASTPQNHRSFSTGFESTSGFSGFYLVPQNYQNAASHNQVAGGTNGVAAHGGSYMHEGWIYGQGPDCPSWVNCNHRGYPTIQMYKTAQGSFSGTVFIEFYVYLNMTVADKQWFSFATLSADRSDSWSRVVLVNLGNLNTGTANYMHLMHVPYHGQSVWKYQASSLNGGLAFPSSPQWVKISVCLNMHPETGYAKVWQNDVLVSSADVRGGCGLFEQAHFGLYAIPTISSGTVYNDDLTMQEVSVCPK